MRNVFLLVVLSIACSKVCAQQFTQKFAVNLPDSIQNSFAEWVDLDNDGLLDILLLAKNQSDESYLMFIKGDTVSAPVLRTEVLPIVDLQNYSMTDYDHDNTMDILVSGTKNGQPITVVYKNKGAFEFEEEITAGPQFTHSLYADLDNDARKEWILCGKNNFDGYLMIYSESGSTWNLKKSLSIDVSSIEIIDANSDGYNDMFVSGRVDADSLFTGFLINNDMTFKPHQANEWIGNTAAADINNDGIFDITFQGKDKSGARVQKNFISGATNYTISDELISLVDTQVFLADLNSDGKVDNSFFGKTVTGDTLHIIRYATQDFDTLPSHRVSYHRFGDSEHDGDLDLLQVVNDHQIRINVLENKTAKNKAPSRPAQTIALKVFDRTFIYWERSADDHTLPNSLTYDLHLQNSGQQIHVGEFDLLNEKRLRTSHGNNGTYNFRLLQHVDAAGVDYMVQAVDNSYHAKEICTGSGGAGGCANSDPQVITLCKDEEVELTGSPNTLWFSFATGFLGKHSSLDFQTEAKDTVFSFNPSLTGCDALKLWTIKVKNDTTKEQLKLKYACEGSSVNLRVEDGWDQIHWESKLKGNLGTGVSITYQFQQPDSIFATLTNQEGCTILRTTALNISKPVVTVEADRYKILRGDEVHLNARGAEHFQWNPETALSKIDIPDPIAFPSSTIQYTVTGYDSLECSGQATVTIVVEGSGFIPSLFTPNGDNTNDHLRIYGLTTADDFMLSILNREGSVVYKTKNISEALQSGWDGTHNGVKQPAGVYIWKVKGVLPSGDKLLLNDKTSGSIVLVR